MKSIVVLGAGTGGTLIANLLCQNLDLKQWQVTVIDRSSEHHYQPGYLFLPFRLYDYEDRSQIARPIRDQISNNARFVQADVTSIDHEHKRVHTSDGDYPYDWLVCALGCRIAPDEVDGMEEALGRNGVHTFYTLEHALGFQQTLAELESGRLVVHISDMPIKCPVAPIEFAFLADYFFELKGVREQIDISLVTPFSGAFTKPNANRVLSKVAEEKGIHIVPNFSIESLDAGARAIHSFEGDTVEYDVLATIPPNLGPEVLEDSGLGDGTGYALTDPRTLKSRKAEFIYCMGDNTNVSTSKAGSVAHFEAETVLENLLREIAGEKPLPSFDGHANCYIETGYHKAMLLDFNYDVEPVEGTFPFPVMGPFSLLKESHLNHMGKIAFDWVYWHMLLPGYLPMVPLLPSHMSFVGKDVAGTPQVRRSRAMKVGDVMTAEPITVTQGTPLAATAQLLTEHNVSGLPVVDVDGRLIGVVTEADFLATMDVSANTVMKKLFDAIIRRGRPRKRMGSIVDDIMTPKPVTARKSDSLQRAIELMERNRVKRLVITDNDNRVEGVVSRPDIVKLFLMKV